MKQFFGKKSRRTLTLVITVSLALHIVAIVIFGTIKFVSAVLREEKVFEAATIAPPPEEEEKRTVEMEQMSRAAPPPQPPTLVVNNPSELDIPWCFLLRQRLRRTYGNPPFVGVVLAPPAHLRGGSELTKHDETAKGNRLNGDSGIRERSPCLRASDKRTRHEATSATRSKSAPLPQPTSDSPSA